MSRSYKKNSFSSWCSSKSMKAWRTQENRKLRHNAKQIINTCEDYDALIIPVINDYDTLWGSPQDGSKHYVEKPLMNKCVFESQGHDYIRFICWRTRKILVIGEHDYNCNCYTNKKGWYWRNMRK